MGLSKSQVDHNHVGILILFITIVLLNPAISTTQNIAFRLFKPEIPEEWIEVYPKQLYCHQSFNIEKYSHVFFIIHGWLQSSNDSYIQDIRKLLLQKRKESVIIEVDWSQIARKDYNEAKKFNGVVANATSNVLSCLLEDFKVPHENIEIISHCMGCHIAGIAGRDVHLCTGKRIGKIVALDPAGPMYFNAQQSERLGPSDADIVFVVHTDAFMFGFGEPCGTIDFYPNGGMYPQPGCLDKRGVVEYDLCSHQRSIILYIESLMFSKLLGVNCRSYREYKLGLCSSNEMINFAKPFKSDKRGIYFIKTNSKEPFL